MLTVKPVYKLSNVFDNLKWTTNTHVTPFTPTSKAFIRPPIFLPVHIDFTRPHDGLTDLRIKLCHPGSDGY